MAGANGAERAVWFHAGTHKTGTTAIQQFLRQNRDRLAEQGIARVLTDEILTPDSPQRAAHRIAETIQQGPTAPRWDTVAAAVAAVPADMPLLLSSERLFRYLAGAKTEAARQTIIDTLRTLFGPRITIVLYVRNFGDYFNSLVAERIVGTSDARPIPGILRALFTLADIGPVVAHLRSALGPDAVCIRSFDRAARAEGGLLRDFIEGALGQKMPGDLRHPAGPVHGTPPPDVLALKYQLNMLGLDASLYPVLRGQAARIARRRKGGGAFRVIDDALVDLAIAEGRRRNPGIAEWSGIPEETLFSPRVKDRPVVDLAGFSRAEIFPALVEFYQLAALEDGKRFKPIV